MGTDYPTSSQISGSAPSTLPHFNLLNTVSNPANPPALNGLVDFLQWNFGTPGSNYRDEHGYSIPDGGLRLLDLLGYGVHPKPSNLSAAVSTGVVVTPFRLLAYQKIFNDFYRLPLYQPVDVYSFNIDDCISNSTGDVDLGSVPFDDGTGTTTGKFNRLKPMYILMLS